MNFKNGFYYDKKGYKRILTNEKRNGRRKYKYEHICIMEQYLGRNLYKNETVHHINKIITDNRLENLKIMSRNKHTRLHMSGRKVSDETRKLFKKQRKGTNQKEKHPQWKSSITKDIINIAKNKSKTWKAVSVYLGINIDTLRARRKYYNQ